MKRSKIAELAEVAAGQWGMITTAQADTLGISTQAVARLARVGELERLTHGVYRLAGAPPHPHDDLRAAWLAIDPRHTTSERLTMNTVQVVSHRSAALLHQLGDLDADYLEFTTAARHQTRRSDIRIHRGIMTANDWTLVDGLPATNLLRTIVDLASTHLDRGHLAGVVRDALTGHNLSIANVAATLSRYAHTYGVTAGDGYGLVELMLEEAGVPTSTLEVAAHLSGEARRALVDHLVARQAIPANKGS